MLPSREIAIEVAVAMPVHGTFTYRVPEDLARLASAGVVTIASSGTLGSCTSHASMPPGDTTRSIVVAWAGSSSAITRATIAASEEEKAWRNMITSASPPGWPPSPWCP